MSQPIEAYGGEPRHGRWLIAPANEAFTTRREYRRDFLVLETTFTTSTGSVRIVDCMPLRDRHVDVIRLVEGVSGDVAMRMDLVIRFDYGSIVPWMQHIDGTLRAIAGPDALCLVAPVETRGFGLTTQAEFTVREGECLPFRLTWHPSNESPSLPGDTVETVGRTRDMVAAVG